MTCRLRLFGRSRFCLLCGPVPPCPSFPDSHPLSCPEQRPIFPPSEEAPRTEIIPEVPGTPLERFRKACLLSFLNTCRVLFCVTHRRLPDNAIIFERSLPDCSRAVISQITAGERPRWRSLREIFCIKKTTVGTLYVNLD